MGKKPMTKIQELSLAGIALLSSHAAFAGVKNCVPFPSGGVNVIACPVGADMCTAQVPACQSIDPSLNQSVSKGKSASGSILYQCGASSSNACGISGNVTTPTVVTNINGPLSNPPPSNQVDTMPGTAPNVGAANPTVGMNVPQGTLDTSSASTNGTIGGTQNAPAAPVTTSNYTPISAQTDKNGIPVLIANPDNNPTNNLGPVAGQQQPPAQIVYGNGLNDLPPGSNQFNPTPSNPTTGAPTQPQTAGNNGQVQPVDQSLTATIPYNQGAGNPPMGAAYTPTKAADNYCNGDTPCAPGTMGSGNSGNGNPANTGSDTTISKSEDLQNSHDIKKTVWKPSNDDCKLSGDVDASGNCSGMRTTMAVTQVSAQVASQIGSQAVNMIGQQSQQTAILNGGSIASIYQSSAKLSEKAAEANMGMGAMQVGMGFLINSEANKHAKVYSNQYKNLKYGAVDNTTVKGDAPSSVTFTANNHRKDEVANQVFNLGTEGVEGMGSAQMSNGSATITNTVGSNAKLTMTAEKNAALSSADSYAHAAGVEQNTAALDGHNSARVNWAPGAIVSGGFQYAQAKQMEKLYAQMANAPTITAPGADPFAAPGAIRSASTVTGDGTDGNTAAATAAVPTAVASGGPLGAPLGNLPGGANFGAPIDPGAQAAAAPTSPGGGALGGAAGGIGTSAVPGGATDDKPAQYDANRKDGGYDGVGGFAPGASGGKGNSNDPSIDPKSLMAAMLDQLGQKKDDELGQGIMNYGRNIASDANAPMPAEENFFVRFHADYQEFQRKGRVGL
jgi:hypothetical protein